MRKYSEPVPVQVKAAFLGVRGRRLDCHRQTRLEQLSAVALQGRSGLCGRDRNDPLQPAGCGVGIEALPQSAVEHDIVPVA